ncbi:hypothetical protein SAMN06296386_10315 [Lachnospiraceae bacterium]|nr:hypothetical protein SAMN06296386_10315 [Lachnospiraceae bacterium]
MAEDQFNEALAGKHVPVLTLDNKWHRLLKEIGETKEMRRLQDELNELIKHQGKINTEEKDLKKIKNNLMSEIMKEGTGEASDRKTEKKLEESRRLINEINEKLEEYYDEMKDLPKKISEVNNQLMLLTMKQSYDVIKDNTRDIEVIGDWIKTMRMELKRKILEKQHMELVNVELYSYMQGIFGPSVVDLFDIHYDIEAERIEILARAEARREEKARQIAKEIKDAGEEAEKKEKEKENNPKEK